MANNFKNIEQRFTTNGSTALLTCTTTSIIVNSVTFNVDGGDLAHGLCQLKLKRGSSASLRTIKTIQHIDRSSTDPFRQFLELIDRPLILENGHQLWFQHAPGTATGITVTVNYLEQTADVATSDLGDLTNVSPTTPSDGQVLAYNQSDGEWQPQTVDAADIAGVSDTGDLPQDTTGAEPRNRYMRGFNALDELTDDSSATPAETMLNSPDAIQFVVENTDLSTVKPMKITYEDFILAILQSGIEDLVDSDQNNYTLDTFTFGGQLADFDDNGTVGTSDLLEFLTLFGQEWSTTTSALFESSAITINIEDVDLNASFQTIPLTVAGSVTNKAGTQIITYDTTNNLIKIADGDTPVHFHDVPGKRLLLGSLLNAYDFAAPEAGVSIQMRFLIKLYSAADVQLGDDIIKNLAATGANYNIPFASASYVIDQPSVSLTTSSVDNQSFIDGVFNDGWSNQAVEYFTIEIQARVGVGISATVNSAEFKIFFEQE